MNDNEPGIAPRSLARIGGVLYLINIVLGAYEELGIREKVLSRDLATTAANLHAMEPLWRLGIGSELFVLVTGIPLLVILYVLLRPVNKPLVVLATLFCAIGATIQASAVMYLLEALFPLGSDAYLKAFTPDQLNAMVSLALKEHTYAFAVALIFFAGYQITLGLVIFKSGYMPKVVGVLLQLGGAGYLVNNFAVILYPPITSWLFPVSAVPALLGELSLCLYMLFKGVDLAKYEERLAVQAA